MCPSEVERIRSFVAVDLGGAVRAAMQELLAQFARLKADIRWVRREGLHVTLKFLGAVEAPRLERVHAAVAAAVADRPALQLRVQGLGAFPSLRRPRVLWVGLHGHGLVELAACVVAAVTPLGFEPETRAFTPHVTLGRVNGLRGWPRLEELVEAHREDEFGTTDIDAVTIYRSTLRPGGSMYTPLWTIPLLRNKEGVHYDNNRC
jgi:RNA 2',3'-cyclic 3'-phosphodiesterase